MRFQWWPSIKAAPAGAAKNRWSRGLNDRGADGGAGGVRPADGERGVGDGVLPRSVRAAEHDQLTDLYCGAAKILHHVVGGVVGEPDGDREIGAQAEGDAAERGRFDVCGWGVAAPLDVALVEGDDPASGVG